MCYSCMLYYDLAKKLKRLMQHFIRLLQPFETSLLAFKSFSSQKQDLQGPMTRSRKQMKLRHPIQHGNLGKLSTSILTNALNRLPLNIKSKTNFKQAKNLIKNTHISNHHHYHSLKHVISYIHCVYYIYKTLRMLFLHSHRRTSNSLTR